MFAHRSVSGGERGQWAIDTVKAVAGEVAAGLKISQGRAETKVRHARAMGERLPAVAAVFCAGDIDLEAFATIVFRTDLIVGCEDQAPPQDYCAERTAMMPTRRRTRAQDRAARVAAERRANRQTRTTAHHTTDGPAPPDDETPPF